ncbi:hypothetical protein HDU82_006145 [Entophlyctis luteolus]|nr:hypothetical protein HDU82_006145 [Entophlyctis luteolus]
MSSSAYIPCYIDITGLNPTTNVFDRLTIQSNSAGSQIIALADVHLSMQTVSQLTDQHAYSSGAAIGSNTLFMIGDGPTSAVNVSLNGQIVPISSFVSLTSPVTCTYFTLSSSWTPGSYTVRHANGTFSIIIPSSLATTLNNTATPINPLVYGINLPDTSYVSTYGNTLARWGGNALTTFNHPISTPSSGYYNTDSDWYFENEIYPENLANFVARLQSAGAKTFASLPALDWVSAPIQPCFVYNASKYGASTASDPYNANAGNGVLANGSRIVNNPSDCYTPWSSTALTSWLTSFIANTTVSNNIAFYSVDNEMDICSGTHVDIHPTSMTYDEELQRMLTFGGAIRKAIGASSNTKIVGPTSCCFYFWWNSAAGSSDMSAHGGISKLRYLLRGWKTALPTTGTIFNGLDLHFNGEEGRSLNGSASDNASRLRATRNWWDTTYVDESWRGVASNWPASEPNPGIVAFIPRMRQLIADEYPGLLLGASEWYTNGDLVGGLTDVDTLGIFGRYGLDFATKWGGADAKSAGAAAFWLFTGGSASSNNPFLSYSVSTPVFYDPNLAGVYFASTSSSPTGSNTAGIFVNKDPSNYQSYKISGWKAGTYTVRHFGYPGQTVTEQGLMFSVSMF